MKKKAISKNKQYLFSILSVTIISLLCFLFSSYMNPEVAAFMLLLNVSINAMLFEIWPVLLSAFLSAVSWEFFFLAPHFAFYISKTEDVVTLCMYFVIAMINGALTYKIRQIENVAHQKEEKAHTIKLYNTVFNSLSHELRTPVATIIAATDNLLSENNQLTTNDKNNLVSEISIASLRLNSQVENLLNMSRLESGFIQPKKDWCDIEELINTVINQLHELLRNHILKIIVHPQMPLVKIDHGLIEQSLYNILHNAAVHTPEKTVISINVSFQNNIMEITIIDNGKGFPEDEIKNAFDKFYRLKNTPSGGIGLGLSVSKGFVEAHDGTILLENIVSGGTKFTIEIPADMNFLNIAKHEA